MADRRQILALGLAGVALAVQLMQPPPLISILLLAVSLFLIAWAVAPDAIRRRASNAGPLAPHLRRALDSLDKILSYAVAADIGDPDRLASERETFVKKALSGLSPESLTLLRAMLTSGRPPQVSDNVWMPLESAGLVERDYTGPKGIKEELKPAVEANLENFRHQATKTKLQEFYVNIGDVLNQHLSRDMSSVDFEQYVARSNRCITEVADWIEQNLGKATRERFLDKGGMLAVSVQGAINERHNSIIVNLERYRKNLLAMIDSGAWV